jgi:hypothetical protein
MTNSTTIAHEGLSMTEEELSEIIENDEDWDTGALGRDEKYARRAILTPEQEESLETLTEEIIKKTGPVPPKYRRTQFG